MTQFSRRLKTFDPGWIRLEQVVKGGLAMATAMGSMLCVMVASALQAEIAPVIFGFIVAFVSFMVANEPQPHERRRTMILAAVPFIVAPFVAAVAQASALAVAVLLLALMYLSFYVRRYGQRAAELGIAAVLSFYFAWLFGARPSNALWFALGAVIGAASAFFWQFVVEPFDPQRYLRRGITAFGESAADSVAAISHQWAASGSIDELHLTLKRVYATRRAIEVQLAGLAGAPGWTRENLGQLRVCLFNVQQGLEQLATSTTDLVKYRGQIPQPVRVALAQSLAALHDVLLGFAAPEAQETLKQAIARLMDQAHAIRVESESWKAALTALSAGEARVAQWMHGVRTLTAQARPAPLTQAAAVPHDDSGTVGPAASDQPAQSPRRGLRPQPSSVSRQWLPAGSP
jgi:hypothetical protein